MKRFLAVVVLSLMSGLLRADELANGISAWEAQNYTLAFSIFSKLADAGNVDAQQQLGEMYGFGEGTTEDHFMAAQWLGKAISGGSKEALRSLTTIRLRADHKAEIAQFTDGYAGDDIRLSKFACVKPVIPERSETQVQMKSISTEFKAWMECYGRFIQNLSAALPAGKAIPGDIAVLMNTQEISRARARMEQIYAQEGEDAKKQATQLIASYNSWAKNTELYVKEANALTENITKNRPLQMAPSLPVFTKTK